jgi:plasmid stabilization system protein ParE
MTYRLEIAESAKADIREAVRWLRDQASPTVADRWLAGLHKAMNTLRKSPRRCPVAAESDRFPEEIRELLHGRRRRHVYRILFTIREDLVVVLYVRHGARDELQP